MRQYIFKRLVGFFVVLIGVSILSFMLLSLSKVDPAEVIARRGNANVTPQMIEEIRGEMGLDASMMVRYGNWVKGLFSGDVGISIYSYRPIAQDLIEYLPVTFSLVGLSLLWTVIVAVPISIICARFKNSLVDHAIREICILGICMPPFWLGFLLLLGFAVKIPLFKVMPEAGIKGYILPSIALSIPVICAVIRLFRASLLSELSKDYVQYAKARGMSPIRIFLGHVLRNALPPIVTVFCQYLGYLIAGSAVVESVFSLKGVGSYLISCVTASDSIAVATCIVIIAGVFVLANLIGDLINRILCPWMVSESNG